MDFSTPKTTLAGAFAEAAAKRNERTLYVAFDESAKEIVRNLSSVNICLQPHLDNGTLLMHSENVASLGAEEYFHRLETLVQRHQATCLVVDPFTAFSNAGKPGRYPGGRWPFGPVGKKPRDYFGLHELCPCRAKQGFWEQF